MNTKVEVKVNYTAFLEAEMRDAWRAVFRLRLCQQGIKGCSFQDWYADRQLIACHHTNMMHNTLRVAEFAELAWGAATESGKVMLGCDEMYSELATGTLFDAWLDSVRVIDDQLFVRMR